RALQRRRAHEGQRRLGLHVMTSRAVKPRYAFESAGIVDVDCLDHSALTNAEAASGGGLTKRFKWRRMTAENRAGLGPPLANEIPQFAFGWGKFGTLREHAVRLVRADVVAALHLQYPFDLLVPLIEFPGLQRPGLWGIVTVKRGRREAI